MLLPPIAHTGAEVGDVDILGGSSPSGKPGGASDATYNSVSGCVEFSGAADNEWFWPDFQTPHSVDTSVYPRPHLHLIHPTSASGKVSRWRLQANYAAIGQPLAATYGSFAYDQTISVTNPAEADHHGVYAFPQIAIPNQTVSSVINFKLTRLAGSDGADNDANMIAVKSLDLHQRAVRIGKTVTGT